MLFAIGECELCLAMEASVGFVKGIGFGISEDLGEMLQSGPAMSLAPWLMFLQGGSSIHGSIDVPPMGGSPFTWYDRA